MKKPFNQRAVAFAPASLSNLGPGFDVLGLAIDEPGDTVTAIRRQEPGLLFRIRSTVSDVPTDPAENLASYVAQVMLEELNPGFGIELLLDKGMPIGSGLGSSAASSVAAAMAVNAILDKPFSKLELLPFALAGEKKASGGLHADNVAPSLLGGVCLIRSYDPLDIVQIPVRGRIVWAVVTPDLQVNTREARQMLPSEVPFRQTVRQMGNLAGLTLGLARGDAQLVGRSVEDVIVEPVRARLIPGFYEVKAAAMAAGALGCSISGSGPTLFAVTDTIFSARRINRAMSNAFREAAGVKSTTRVSRVNRYGATILAEAAE